MTISTQWSVRSPLSLVWIVPPGAETPTVASPASETLIDTTASLSVTWSRPYIKDIRLKWYVPSLRTSSGDLIPGIDETVAIIGPAGICGPVAGNWDRIDW